MSRLFSALIILMMASFPVLADGVSSELTGKTLLSKDSLVVGDVFTNAGANADHVLAPAPSVGSTMTLTKNDLQRIASAFRLKWQAPENEITVTLQRDAVLVDQGAVITALQNSDLKTQIANDAEFKLNDDFAAITLEGQQIPELQISDISFDPSSEKFNATLHISRDGQVIKTLPVNGIATAMLHIPVLRNAVTANTVLSSADLTEIVIPAREVHGNVVTDKDIVIGMVSKRSMQANKLIATSDVMAPVVVKRNELITVTYINGAIRLSTKARAMANGAKGDTISLMNVTSKKPFDALITGPQQAEVGPQT